MKNKTEEKIPCWLVWGMAVKDGDLHLLSVSLTYSHANYVYKCNKDKPQWVTVRIEKTQANHAMGTTSLLVAANDLAKQNIEEITRGNDYYNLCGQVRELLQKVFEYEDIQQDKAINNLLRKLILTHPNAYYQSEQFTTKKCSHHKAAIDVAQKCLEALKKTPCLFWVCPGPDKPHEDMKTCVRCAAIQDVQDILDKLDN